MYSSVFLLAAVAYVFLAIFLFFSLPGSWRRNSLFMAILILWQLVGLTSIVLVFTVFRDIPYEGIRYEICRVGSMYYITTTIQAILFAIRAVSSRTYLFIARHTDFPIRLQGERRVSDKRFHAVLIIVLSFVLFFIGFFNIDFLHDTRYEVSIPANTQEKELNICLIADIHAGAGTWEYTYDDMEMLINNANPDVLLIAGDVFDETTGVQDIENFAWVLQTIRQPRYGIYFVYGNHDSIYKDWAGEKMRAAGAIVLKDEMTLIGEDIQLIGCMDPKHQAKSPEELFRDCAPDPSKPILVLTHRPSHFSRMARLGCDLVMAGHTHGFNIPQFLGSALLGDMYSGIKQYGEMDAVTTSGVSAWGFHYKWPAISEVVTIHVTFTGDAGE
ncbi:MAG: metallophosphoesterase [Clostridia bacterium]|nr:metallophosphoesterase [Clostridia bacterium]